MLDWDDMPPRRATVILSARVAPELATRVTEMARRSGISQNAWIERALAIQVVREDAGTELANDSFRDGPQESSRP